MLLSISSRFSVPRLLIGLLLSLYTEMAWSITQANISVQRNQNIEIHLGDVVTDVIKIRANSEGELSSLALPKEGPVNEWLIIRKLTASKYQDGAWWVLILTIDYQLFKGVTEPEEIIIPALNVMAGRDVHDSLAVPNWPITLTPMIPSEFPTEDIEIKEALAPSPLPTDLYDQRAFYLWCGLLGMSFLGMLYSYFIRLMARPFGRALSDIQRILRKEAAPLSLAKATKRLHRAFNQTYGFALYRSDLYHFFEMHPKYRVLEIEIFQFFDVSHILFFSPSGLERLPSNHLEHLLVLVTHCAELEKKESKKA